jgi:hypothetical protein
MRVKGFVSLLTALLITSVLPQVAHAADLPSFEIKSVSSTMIDPGDTVTWKIQVNLIPGWTKGLTLNLIDPSGQVRQIYTLVDNAYDVKEKKSVETLLSLKTNEYDLAGKYRLNFGYITNVTEVFYYDPINGKEYAGKGTNSTAQNMSQFDFTIRDAGSGKQKTPQFIESIGFSKSQINPGASAKLELKTSGTGSLVSTNVWLTTPDGTMSIYCDASNLGNSSSCQGVSSSNGKYEFSMPVWTAGDSSPGTYKINKVLLNYRNGDPSSSGNDTANWGGYVYYEESEVLNNGVKSQLLSKFPQTGLSFTLLDAGQGLTQAPVWTELVWKKNSVKAGTTATLIVTANGFNRNLVDISVPILTTLGGKNEFVYTNQSGQATEVRQIKPAVSKTMLPAVQTGSFEVDVYVPRNAKPGTYAIGQISLLSTTCSLSTMKDIYTNSPVNNQNCQSWPNGSRTTFYMGNLSKDFGSSSVNTKQWNGYVNPLAAQMEVTAAAPLEAPKLEEVDVGPSAIEYRYQYSSDQTCSGSASAGDLVDDKTLKDKYWTLKVNNLKPDSAISLKLICTDAAGAKAESSIDSRTSKPIPPASPKLTLDSVTTNSATFTIGIREDFKYTVKSESGEAQILGNKESGYKVQVTGLKPGIKTNLVATITDSYGQSTSTEPLYFSAELPAKPSKPELLVGKLSTTRVEFKYEKLANLDYELTVSEGDVSDIRGSVTVSGLTPNTKITASLKVTDEFGQSTTSDDLIIKSAIPELPAIPTLYLVKTSSDSVTLRFAPRAGIKYQAKVSSGSAVITDGLIAISSLKPATKIQVTLIMNDAYGQLKYSDSYSYTTAAAPKTATKTSITCIKGKTSKVITAVKPTCPSGYTKK